MGCAAQIADSIIFLLHRRNLNTWKNAKQKETRLDYLQYLIFSFFYLFNGDCRSNGESDGGRREQTEWRDWLIPFDPAQPRHLSSVFQNRVLSFQMMQGVSQNMSHPTVHTLKVYIVGNHTLIYSR